MSIIVTNLLFVAVPEEFQYDPVTRTYGDPSRRPEVRSATIEFLAPADYMVKTDCILGSKVIMNTD